MLKRYHIYQLQILLFVSMWLFLGVGLDSRMLNVYVTYVKNEVMLYNLFSL